MKQEELMESIYGCLERIENKVNGLSMPQSADGDSEVGISVNDAAIQEFKQELNGIKHRSAALQKVYLPFGAIPPIY